jgi:predicted CXXCH cytochrome family protein
VRKLVYVVATTLALFGFSSAPAWADNGPHVPTSQKSGAIGATSVDRCAGCHRAHTAKATYLLKDTQPALCYTCHGGAGSGASTDVQDGVQYTGFERGGTPVGALRGGGFEYALLDSGNASKVMTPPATAGGRWITSNKLVPVAATRQATTSAHSVDGTAAIAWGGSGATTSNAMGTQVSLRCGSCHDPHGNGNYRILRAIPQESGLPSTSTGVVIPDATTKVYTTSNYWAADDPNVPVNAASTSTPKSSQFIQNIAAWCTTCHTRYLAPSGSFQTPSGDATYMYRHRSDDGAKEGGANCITCHVAHGSNAQMTGTYSQQVTNPDGTITKAGDSKLLRVNNRGTCNMCHDL